MRKSAWKLALTGLLVVSPATLFALLYRFDWYGGTLRRWVDQFDLPTGARVLELGCGPGDLSAYLVQKGYKVTGVDRSERMISAAHRRAGNASFQTADALHLPFEDNSFDLVIAASLLNVVTDRAALLQEMARVTDSDGKFSTLFPTPEFSPKASAIYAGQQKISSLETAAIDLWSGKAKQLNLATVTALFLDVGATNVTHRGNLDGMLMSVQARP